MSDVVDTMDVMDVMDALAGIAPGSRLAELRRQRPDVVKHLRGSDEAIFSPRDDGGLSQAERAATALRVAILLGDETLEAHYAGRLAELDASDTLMRTAQAGPKTVTDPRWAVTLAHVDRVTQDPDSAKRQHLDELLGAGLSPHALVSLSQLIAYVNFQSRVLAGLRMLSEG
jgi:CMD domain protein